MIKVSVIMPCLNVVPYIKQCIDSVVNQTIFDELEIIIVDAGSNDGTIELLSCYERKYPNINLCCVSKKSYGYQVNHGIKKANGKYISIVETDDYICENMYEILYNTAQNGDADYVKADCDRFIARANGQEIKWVVNMMKGVTPECDTILDPSANPLLFVADTCIWNGIYKKGFILDQKIWLNESKGAAYQDIGFSQLIHAKAHRAIYIDKSLYRYRICREGSSVSSGKGLIYGRQEFERLFLIADTYGLQSQSLYVHMFNCLLGELSLIKSLDVLTRKTELSDAIRWFVDNIDQAIKNDIVNWSMFSSIEKERYMKIKNGFVDVIKESIYKYNSIIKSLLDLRADISPHIIFGASSNGKRILSLMDRLMIRVDMFFDNNICCDETIGGIPVVCPEKKHIRNNAVVLIASKEHKSEMTNQLLEMGMVIDRIYDTVI